MKLSKRIKERGAAIYVTAVILVMAVPMAGLAIDGTVLYIVKCRLQGAVDGAALAAARSLARGSDDPSQIASAKTAAVTYVKLNFPSNYFFTSDVTIDQNTDVSVVALQGKWRPVMNRQSRVNSCNQTLGGSLLVAGCSIHLTGKIETADQFGLEGVH